MKNGNLVYMEYKTDLEGREYTSYIEIYPDTAEEIDAKMWRVTVTSYYSYQASYEYRDIYLDDNGVTQLLVYEGPIEYDQTRK